ncbi:hypothetical protein C8Q80DRAFT_267348 [Daedaleopsis nitida]|nr:hypothetical protein C8Q80DRAFT_267348 [Daedaleopsis nitida]
MLVWICQCQVATEFTLLRLTVVWSHVRGCLAALGSQWFLHITMPAFPPSNDSLLFCSPKSDSLALPTLLMWSLSAISRRTIVDCRQHWILTPSRSRRR